MQNQALNTAHYLYALYETLPDDIQHSFLQELFQKQADKLENLSFYLACQVAKEENEFLTEPELTDFINSLPQ